MKLSSYDSVGQKSNIGLSLGQNQGVSRAVFPEAFGENLFLCFFQLPEAAHFLAHEHLSPPSRPVMASLVLLTLCVCFFDPSSIVIPLPLATAGKVSLLLSMNSRH